MAEKKRSGMKRVVNGSDAANGMANEEPARPSPTLQPSRTRAVKKAAFDVIPENAIRPSRRASREQANPKKDAKLPETPTKASRAAVADRNTIPPGVRERFMQVGKEYFFPDGARAFTDQGQKLTTPSENTEVIRSLIEIAKARGWSRITVSGTERFRQEAWQVASRSGIDVRGFTPNPVQRQRVLSSAAQKDGREYVGGSDGERQSAQSDPPPRRSMDRVAGERDDAAAARRDGLVVGKLVAHGPAPYRHDPQESMSYFIKVETSRGERVVWGVDLERALRNSLTQPKVGEEIGLRAVDKEPVTVKSRTRDSGGKVIGERELTAQRNRWIVERHSFFQSRATAADVILDPTITPQEAVKRHPELAGTYLQVRAAELAARQMRDVEDQKNFVNRVREALADAVARGEPLPPVRLRDRSVKENRTRSEKRAKEPLVRG